MDDLMFKIKDLSGEYKTRSFTVNKEVLKQFTDLCKKEYGFYTIKDLHSIALLEFIEKYSKEID